MSGVIQSPSGVVHAHCDDCEWNLERSLEAGDGLSVEDNREIAERVAWYHANFCSAVEHGTADVDVSVSGGGS